MPQLIAREPLIRRYLSWTVQTASQLRGRVVHEDIVRLLQTPGYRILVARSDVADADPLLLAELKLQAEELLAAVEELEREYLRWHDRARIVIADTTVYLNHPEQLDVLDLRPALGLDSTVPPSDIHMLIPMVVIDELERHKDKGDDHYRRWARSQLAVIERLLYDRVDAVKEAGMLANGTGVEVLYDRPGRDRLDLEDAEIIDRALEVARLASTPHVVLLTYDTNQTLRARQRGLPTIRIDEPRRQRLNREDRRAAQRQRQEALG